MTVFGFFQIAANVGRRSLAFFHSVCRNVIPKILEARRASR